MQLHSTLNGCNSCNTQRLQQLQHSTAATAAGYQVLNSTEVLNGPVMGCWIIAAAAAMVLTAGALSR
jgi:hypothetical protein